MKGKIFLLLIFGFIIFEISRNGIPSFLIPNFLAQCSYHDKSDYHVHSTLEISQDGKKISIPANLGVTKHCMRPLHTHDATGLIHIEHKIKFIPTLGDFFNTMGIILSDEQVGALKTKDGYSIQVYVDGKEVESQYREIKLVDRRLIKIVITSP